MGINIFPIGYPLCPIGPAEPGAGPDLRGPRGRPSEGSGGGRPPRTLRKGPADRAGPAPGSAAPIGHRA